MILSSQENILYKVSLHFVDFWYTQKNIININFILKKATSEKKKKEGTCVFICKKNKIRKDSASSLLFLWKGVIFVGIKIVRKLLGE